MALNDNSDLYQAQLLHEMASMRAPNVQQDLHNMQLQQRILSQLAQDQFAHGLNGTVTPEQHEALRAEAMRKIMEAERLEAKRRRKAAKIAHMVSRHVVLSEYLSDHCSLVPL